MSEAPFPVVTLLNDSRCTCRPYWRILVDGVIVGEGANTDEARACAEELAVKPEAAAWLRDTCAAEDLEAPPTTPGYRARNRSNREALKGLASDRRRTPMAGADRHRLAQEEEKDLPSPAPSPASLLATPVPTERTLSP